MRASDLKRAITQTAFAANRHHPMLKCILIQPTDFGVHFVAADGFRLCRTSIDSVDISQEAKVEAKFLKSMKFPKNSEVSLSVDEKEVVFQGDGRRYVFPNSQSTFPSYEKVFPDAPISATFPTEVFKRAVEGAIERSPDKKITIGADTDLYVAVGDFKQYVPTQYWNGVETTFLINAKFLTDFFKVIDSDVIGLLFPSPNVLLRAGGLEYVVAPMRW